MGHMNKTTNENLNTPYIGAQLSIEKSVYLGMLHCILISIIMPASPKSMQKFASDNKTFEE